MNWDGLLASALKCGIGVEEFWSLTPKETHMAIEAAGWIVEQQHRRDAWLAWHVAALSRAKRLPTLRQLVSPGRTRTLEGEELERRRQEKREMLEKIDLSKINEAKRRGA